MYPRNADPCDTLKLRSTSGVVLSATEKQWTSSVGEVRLDPG